MHFALENKYPIETEGHVKTAVEYFDKNLTRFTPEARVKIAFNVSRRIDHFGLDIDRPWISNYSRALEKTASFSPDFKTNMKARIELAKVANAMFTIGDKSYPVYQAVESFMSKCASGDVSPGEAVDFITEVDKCANFAYHYDKRIGDPFMTVFGCQSNPDYDLEKTASCGTSKKHVGRALKKKAVMTKLAETFGDSFAQDFASSPDSIYNSMPAPEKQLITEILQG
jgi:hypothetical protein